VLALSFMGLRTPDAPTAAALSGMAHSIGYLLAAIGPALFGLFRSVTTTWTTPLLLLCLTTTAQAIAGFLAGGGTLRPVEVTGHEAMLAKHNATDTTATTGDFTGSWRNPGA
jgi:hypothetical protein